MDLAAGLVGVHGHDARRDWISVDAVEDAEYLLIVDSNREEVQPALVQVLAALAPGQEHPIAGQGEHRHQQLDIAEGGHLVEQEGVAGWAYLWTDRCCEAAADGP